MLQYEIRRDDVGGRRGGVRAGRARRRAAPRAPGAAPAGALQRPQQPPVAAAAGLSSRTSKITNNFQNLNFFSALKKFELAPFFVI